jgi:SAM-dependent methyltransferase
MNEWNAGYVSDVGYTYGYYKELNPNHATLAFLNAGYVPPSFGQHCELGFGQGISANIHATAGCTWYATDFNPSQAAFAQSLANTSGSNIYLYDEAFTDFCSRMDLPEFDSIGLHGIWSWISDQNRFIIVDFIRRKLKVGGVLYISYNTLPGWATFSPMRHLMVEHATVIGSTGQGVVSRVNGALDFAQKLLNTNPLFGRANPTVFDRLKKVSEQNRHYIAHEYFNKDWHPMHFSIMSDWLSEAKISFACSAHYLDHIDALNLTSEQQALLKEIPDVIFKETVRDFMVNQQFRRDYWIKGARKLSKIEQTELIKEHRLVLISARGEIKLKITGSLGEANLSEAIYSPVLDLMSDYSIRSIQEIADRVMSSEVSFAQVVQVAMVLIGAGHLASVQTEAYIVKAKPLTAKLNKALINKARDSSEISILASPVTGGGIAMNRFQQLFLLEAIQGKKHPYEWAHSVWSILASQNQRLIKGGDALETSEENLEELTQQAKEFANVRLPILKALQVL